MSQSCQSTQSRHNKCIIFDFDGVLADSFNSLFDLNRSSLLAIGIKLTTEKYQGLFNSNFHLSLKSLVNNPVDYQKILAFRNDKFAGYYSRVKLFKDAPSFVRRIAKNNYLAIVSSTQTKFIEPLLKRHNLLNSFGTVLGTLNHSKEKDIKKIIAGSGYKTKETFFVTDTIGDINIANKIGIKKIAVTWGYHPLDLLKTAKPDNIAKSFKELEELINDSQTERSFKNQEKIQR